MNLPGGTKDLGDINLFNTARRETKEETGGIDSLTSVHGLDVEICGLIGVYPHDQYPNRLCVVFEAIAVGGIMRASTEHPRVDAYPIEEVDEFRDMGVLRDKRVHDAIHRYSKGLVVPIGELTLTTQLRDNEVVILNN